MDKLYLRMKNAERLLKNYFSQTKDDDLHNGCCFLGHQAFSAANECRYTAEKRRLSKLFGRCREMCAEGILPDEDGIKTFFAEDGLDGIETVLLPLAVSCALTDIASEATKKKGSAGERILLNSAASLRRISETDFNYLSEKLFKAEKILLKDPSGAYVESDNKTKAQYRKALTVKAASLGKTEEEIALDAVEKSKLTGTHLGRYIFEKKSQSRGFLFLAMEIIMPLAAAFAASVLCKDFRIGLLLFFPLWEIFRYPVESASLKGVPPSDFLRLSADSEKVRNIRSLITVSVIMPSPDKIINLEKHLEQLYLSNGSENVKVCCLADFKSADTPAKAEDKLIVKAAKEAFDRLNEKHGGGFILALRPRTYSKTQNEFTGKERKRGAITELIRAVKGNEKGFSLIYGDTKTLSETKYLIALDSDTQLVFDSAVELISVAAHPMNKPVIKGGKVCEGYGILVPKAENRLSGRKGGLFSRVMSGDRGIIAYDSLSGERYQDLFGEGVFCGKGLIDVDAYSEVIDGCFPEETVLSHDIVEGGFLRAGYVSDIRICESFPKTTDSFYRRLHRWVRGDWQNIIFIVGNNPLNFISRYKMFDNLRRSLTPAFCVAALVATLLIQGDSGVFAAVMALFALGARNIYAGFSSLKSGGFQGFSRVFFSNIMPGAPGCFARAFFGVAYSARETAVCVSAAATALWRLFVSKKNLLQWTTAAQSEGVGGSLSFLLNCLPSMVLGVLFLAFGLPVHRLFGLILLADIPITLFGNKESTESIKKLSKSQKEKLISYASDMWGFYEDLCGKDNNYLPPDNVQFSPARAVARRTSPTNTGLMLVSFLAARDFGFINTAELEKRIDKSLETVEKLEKYKGNLLNWYNTETLEPLEPKFVSTVDSGNFLCCMTALKEGLREYLAERPSLSEIISRIETLIEKTDLSPMYNSQRKLFCTELYPESGRKSGSCYDLYMSEARMTGYFAVARRIIPKNHWGAMGRLPVADGRYMGLASWTGTMFEYFMPNLFIPSPEESLSRESLVFCLYCQKKRAGRRPFGTSESGIYAFDENLNYQYKANGVQKTAIKKGMNNEYVVSPYSTFLVLTAAPRLAMKNLAALEKMGMVGKYGFFEAADYTKGRNSGSFSVVRSFMAHHVGMSFLSLANMLNKNCMQKRFMRDGFMKGAESLLEERVQTDIRPHKSDMVEEIPKTRERTRGKTVVISEPSPFEPKAMLLSNGRMTSCITDCGTSSVILDGNEVMKIGNDIFLNPQGAFAFFGMEKRCIPFVRATETEQGTTFLAEFRKKEAIHRARSGHISLTQQISLARNGNCEVRKYTVENTGHKNSVKGDLTVEFSQFVNKNATYEWDDDKNCCIISQKAIEGVTEYTVVIGFKSREGEIVAEKSLEKPISCKINLQIEKGDKKSVTLLIAVDESREQAVNTFEELRSKECTEKADNPFYANSLENALAEKALPQIMYPLLREKSGLQTNEACFSVSDLRKTGLSGELPITLLKTKEETNAETCLPYIRVNKCLRNHGIKSDMVILYEGNTEKFSVLKGAIRKLLKEESCQLMEGVKGGIHILDSARLQTKNQLSLEYGASFTAFSYKLCDELMKKPFKPLEFDYPYDDKKDVKSKKLVKHIYFTSSKKEQNKTPETVDITEKYVSDRKGRKRISSDKAKDFTKDKKTSISLSETEARKEEKSAWFGGIFLFSEGKIHDITRLFSADNLRNSENKKLTVFGIDVKAKIKEKIDCTGADYCLSFENGSASVRDFDVLCFALPDTDTIAFRTSSVFFEQNEKGVKFRKSDADNGGWLCINFPKKADLKCFSVKNFFEGSFNHENSISEAGECCCAAGRSISLAVGGKTEVVLSVYVEPDTFS